MISKKICVEYEKNIFINRCMKCNHVKKNPRAKLCLSYGYCDEKFIPR